VIVGEFRDDMPRVVLTLQGRTGTRSIEFILDTAFDGDITLPSALLHELGGTPDSRVRSRLASGVEEYAVAATVAVRWHDGLTPVEAIVYNNNPLLGTALLNGSHIDIEAVEGGQIVIEPM
jgi:predicted aspartyl protease